MAFASDSFTDADGTALQSHVGEVGATWASHPQYTGTYEIRSNRAAKASADTLPCLFLASGLPATAEYDVQLVLHFGSTQVTRNGPAGRVSPTAKTFYAVRYAAGNWQLFKFVAGTATQIGTFASTAAGGDDKTVLLQIRDAAKKVFINGAELISSTDNAITAAGRVGFYHDNGSVGSAGLGQQIDDFIAADTAAAPASYTLTADAGALSVAGSAAALRAARTLAAAPGALALSGSAAALSASRRLAAASGALLLGGDITSLRVARRLAADAGALPLTGAEAGLSVTPVTASAVLHAAEGALSLSGGDAGLRVARRLPAGAGTLPLAGSTALLRRALRVAAESGALPLAGSVIVLRAARRVTAGAGGLVLEGSAASLVWSGAGLPEPPFRVVVSVIEPRATVTVRDA